MLQTKKEAELRMTENTYAGNARRREPRVIHDLAQDVEAVSQRTACAVVQHEEGVERHVSDEKGGTGRL